MTNLGFWGCDFNGHWGFVIEFFLLALDSKFQKGMM